MYNRSEAGFTLFELLAVLAILAVGAMIALPRVAGTRDTAAWRASVQQIAAGLSAARSAAITKSTEHRLIIDVIERRYWADGAMPPRALPRGVSVTFGAPGQEAPGAERAAFTFHPNGGASGGWITVRKGSRKARITVDWLTGATQIHWGG